MDLLLGSLFCPRDLCAFSRCHHHAALIITLLSSQSVMSDSLQPHGLQQARLPCPLPSPKVCSNSSSLSQWCPQPSCPLSSPSPAFNLAQHQGIFQWGSSLHEVAEVLELQLRHQSFQWMFRVGFLWDGLVWSPCFQGALTSLLQACSSKASIWHSAFLMV